LVGVYLVVWWCYSRPNIQAKFGIWATLFMTKNSWLFFCNCFLHLLIRFRNWYSGMNIKGGKMTFEMNFGNGKTVLENIFQNLKITSPKCSRNEKLTSEKPFQEFKFTFQKCIQEKIKILKKEICFQKTFFEFLPKKKTFFNFFPKNDFRNWKKKTWHSSHTSVHSHSHNKYMKQIFITRVHSNQNHLYEIQQTPKIIYTFKSKEYFTKIFYHRSKDLSLQTQRNASFLAAPYYTSATPLPICIQNLAFSLLSSLTRIPPSMSILMWCMLRTKTILWKQELQQTGGMTCITIEWDAEATYSFTD